MLTEFSFVEEYSWEIICHFVIEQLINGSAWGEKSGIFFGFFFPEYVTVFTLSHFQNKR